MKVLIVGSGYSGSLLNYFFFNNGVSVHVIDREEPVTSTKVSAGIMLPLTGRRIVKTFNADNIIPFARETYRNVEELASISFLKSKEVLQIFNSVGNRNEWFASSESPGVKNYTGSILSKNQVHSSVKNDLGGILLQQSGSVDPSQLLWAIKKITESKTVYIKTEFDSNEIELQQTGITWRNTKYDYLIFCEGYETIRNRWFGYIPFKPAKGEILDFTSEKLDDHYIINSSVFILPEGNAKFRAGSTYNWNDLSTTLTDQARLTIEEGIRNTITCDFKITGHKAGIRPTIIDRRPVIGLHPEISRIGIFNGLGTKGAMLAPWYANQFCNFITQGKNIDEDVSINRFNSLLRVP